MFKSKKKLLKELDELRAKNAILQRDNQSLVDAGIIMAKSLNKIRKVCNEQHYNSTINFSNKIKKILDEMNPQLKSL